MTAAVLGVLVLWGSLYLAFRHWRAGYRERQAFGALHVAAAVDPLAAVVPVGESPESWRLAVAETHAMLLTLTAANVLDRAAGRPEPARLRPGLPLPSRPSTARAELSSLWDEVESRAGPIVRSRHPRPALLPPFRPKDDPRAAGR